MQILVMGLALSKFEWSVFSRIFFFLNSQNAQLWWPACILSEYARNSNFVPRIPSTEPGIEARADRSSTGWERDFPPRPQQVLNCSEDLKFWPKRKKGMRCSSKVGGFNFWASKLNRLSHLNFFSSGVFFQLLYHIFLVWRCPAVSFSASRTLFCPWPESWAAFSSRIASLLRLLTWSPGVLAEH